VPAASLNGLSFVVGTASADNLQVRAYDGVNWSAADGTAWAPFNVNVIAGSGQPLTDTGPAGAASAANGGNTGKTDQPFGESASLYADTVVGIDEGGSDRDSLTVDPINNWLAQPGLVNGGQDALVTLADSFTIFPKGISHVDGSIFS